MMGDYSEAKIEAWPAIHLYALKNVQTGVAVAKFDLSRVYDHENKLDSAIYFCNASLNFWET